MLRVGLAGATGIVGQQFVAALHGHPWFQLTQLAASPRSAGKSYEDALTYGGALHWYSADPPPPDVLAMEVRDSADMDATEVDLVFSAVDSSVARVLEPRLAQRVAVVSTASAFRMEPDVPLLISTINASHSALIDRQRQGRGWKGFIAPQPNCSTIGLGTTLKPVCDRWGLNQVIMTSLQSLSGAGRNGGVLGLDILDNVIPFIPKEEEKVEEETRKILGELTPGGLQPANVRVSCTCTRVNVQEGHTEAVFVSTQRPASVAEVATAFRDYRSGLEDLALPSSPSQLITVLDNPYRPQPRLDRDTDGGMTTTVGRIRPDTALENGLKWVLVSHNTKMGAAKGAVLIAELLAKQGYIG